MRVAITIWGNRISPVFDAAQTVLLATVVEKAIVDRTFEFIPLLVPVSIANKIVAFDPDILICGAISREPAHIIEDAGITLLSFISGKAEAVLQTFAQGKRVEDYSMPGCSSQVFQGSP